MKSNIILTKQDVHWHIISNYLEYLSNYCVADTDETFSSLLKQMQKYVNNKLKLNGDGEVIDLFVLVLQQSND